MSIISTLDSLVTGVGDGISSVVTFIVNNPDAIAFLVVFAITIASALFVVISKEVVHSAFYLALTTICVAITYFFLEAEFVAIVQLMVYVGAVTIVFAFSIMLTRNKIMEKKGGDGNG
ncbi:MAG: NADH-quinone oxidoreductase subunit J [Methanomassiliicoccaceae archaeon]|nr:NADH-quinone oxidoreductase subunit J [Methanomassiliicoccaceae archaeon]